MAEELIKVIRVETAGSEQSVAGLKQEINDLRDALLNCEAGSEEYNKVLGQLITDQEKLTSVMAAGVKQASSLDGSYNALVNRMSALKKVWRETTDEATRADLGNQILAINEQLKGMDASIGNYNRNVGDYTNAITTAFDKSLGGIAAMGGSLGKVAGSVKNLIPVIKQANSTATKGLNGVKKALASTGIGALVVAVGLLITYWDDLVKMFKKSDPEYEKLVNANETLSKEFADQNDKMSKQAKLMQAQGASIREVNKEKRALIKTQLLEIQTTLNAIDAAIQEREAHSWLGRVFRGENKELKELRENRQKLMEQQGDLNKSLGNLDNEDETEAARAAKAERDRIKTRQKEIADANKTELQLLREKYEEEYKLFKRYGKDTTELNKQYVKDRNALIVKGLQEQEKVWREVMKEESERHRFYSNSVVEYYEDLEMEILKKMTIIETKQGEAERILEEYKEKLLAKNAGVEGYDVEKDPVVKYYTDLVARLKIEFTDLEESLDNNTDSLNDAKAAERELKNSILLNGLRPEALKSWKELNLAMEEFNKLSKRNDETWDEFDKRQNEAAIKIGELTKKVNQENTAFRNLKDEVADVSKTFKKWENSQWWFTDIFGTLRTSNLYGGIMEEARNAPKAIIENFNAGLKASLGYLNIESVLNNVGAAIEKGLQRFGSLDHTSEIMSSLGIDFFEKPIKEMFDTEDAFNEAMDEYTKNLSKAEAKVREYYYLIRNTDIKDYEETNEELAKSTEGRINNIRELLVQLVETGVIPEEVLTNYLETLKNVSEAEENLLKKRFNNWSELAQNIGATVSSIGDIYAINLENKKKWLEKNGKYDEEARKQLEEEYERVQNVKIAQATIDTIQGAIAAFMAAQEIGGPWGWALGVAQAAAVTAAGIAQIKQIKATNPYSETTPSADVASTTPTVNEYQPVLASNITGQNETATLANAMSKIQPVVRVTDIEDTERLTNVRVEEATF